MLPPRRSRASRGGSAGRWRSPSSWRCSDAALFSTLVGCEWERSACVDDAGRWPVALAAVVFGFVVEVVARMTPAPGGEVGLGVVLGPGALVLFAVSGSPAVPLVAVALVLLLGGLLLGRPPVLAALVALATAAALATWILVALADAFD